MKRYTPFILLALIILPFTTNAFSLDDVVKQWMAYMRQKVATLEAENAELKAQLASAGAIETPAEEISLKTQIAELNAQNIKLSNAIAEIDHADATQDSLRLQLKKTWRPTLSNVDWESFNEIRTAFSANIITNTETIADLETELARNGYAFTRYTAPCTAATALTTSGDATDVETATSYSCQGNLPAHAVEWSGEEATNLSEETEWHYTTSNTARKCEFRCFPGNVWNSGACVRPTSTGGSSGSGWPPAPASA
jgi:hypothetical protein